MLIVIIMVVSCAVLVGIGYLMLDVFSGMVVTPKTPVRELGGEGVLAVPLADAEVSSMQVSGDGRYLAFMARDEGGGGSVLQVVELSGQGGVVLSRQVEGENLAWLGDNSSLVFEDRGDIFLLDLAGPEAVNLTASPERDREPLPSPDGRRILWTVSAQGGTSGRGEFWVMDADGSGKSFLAEAQDLAAWDPAGGKVISRRQATLATSEGRPSYFLQTAVPGREGWEYYVECEGEVLFIWWPAQATVLYLSLDSVKGQDVVKGIWFEAHPPDEVKKVASTDGLGSGADRYRFYPARRSLRVAYVGDKGLEYFDYERDIIHRYRLPAAIPPLAWNEILGELYYAGADGIYRLTLGEE